MSGRVVRTGEHVHLRRPRASDRDAFVEAARRSRRLHHPWVTAPDTTEAFDAYLARSRRRATRDNLLVCRNDDDDGALAGAVNISEIVRGPFQSAFLGYYAFVPLAGKGYMGEGLELVVGHAFEELGLHRLQANVQPANVRSCEMLRRHGFRLESHSPRYLFVGGAWRNHLGFVRLREAGPPVFGARGPVQLHEVDPTRWREAAAVRADRHQKKWVADVEHYLTLCLAEGRWQPLAIRVEERAVGFAMWARDPADGSYWIGGFLIDRREQRKGYGRAALAVLIGALRSMPGCRQIALSYRPDNEVARALYYSAGFRETGETEGDEVVARLDVAPRRRP